MNNITVDATRPKPDDLIQALPPEWTAEIDDLLVRSRTPGAAIALITPSGHYQHCFGRMKASEDRPVTPDTVFSLASLTKAFIATLAVKLAHDGVFGLDDPVKPLLPELNFQPDWINGEISMRDLLSNRLGLERGGMADYGLDPSFSNKDLMRRFSAMRRSGPFRGQFSYCNPAFNAAVLVMERATGQSLGELLDTHVLLPAGMGPALLDQAAASAPDRATGHIFDRNDDIVEVEVGQEWARPGGGGMVSTANDQLRWIALNLGEGRIGDRRILPRAMWKQLWTPHIDIPPAKRELWLGTYESVFAAYALGWFVTDLEGRPMAVHSGGGYGWRTRIALLPDQGIGLSVLMNAYGNVGTSIQHRLLELCLDLPAKPWTGLLGAQRIQRRAMEKAALKADWPVTDDPPAGDVAGFYVSPESGMVAIATSDADITISFSDGDTGNGTLHSMGGDIFEHRIAGPIATYDGPDTTSPRLRLIRDDGAVVAFDHSAMGRFDRCPAPKESKNA
jgi:CubicO group peptidase (beta-lactamase class C family)